MTVLLLAAIFGLLLLVYTVKLSVVVARALLIFTGILVATLALPVVALLRSR